MSSEDVTIGTLAGRWPRNVVVSPASREQQPILANLIELYIYDFSELLHLQLDESARFGYPDLPLYWTEPARHPFLVTIDGRPAGFALVRSGSRISAEAGVWDMAEFFVVRAYRRRGVGKLVASEVWRQLPGRWEVRVMEANVSAIHFWASAVAHCAGHAIHPFTFVADGASWRVFAFDLPA